LKKKIEIFFNLEMDQEKEEEKHPRLRYVHAIEYYPTARRKELLTTCCMLFEFIYMTDCKK
jgi:hypothetical protein